MLMALNLIIISSHVICSTTLINTAEGTVYFNLLYQVLLSRQSIISTVPHSADTRGTGDDRSSVTNIVSTFFFPEASW